MQKISKNIFSLILLSNFIFACNKININEIEVKNTNYKLKIEKNYFLEGKVEFNNPKEDFKINVIDTSSISSRATVTLLYPSDHPVKELKNTAISAGITDIIGNFKFNPSDNFTPKVDEVLVLEANNRVGGIGNANISLRTMVKWNGIGWDSISKPNLYINKKTTAISILSHFTPLVFPSSEAIGRMSVDNNGASSIKYDEKLTSNGLNRILNAVDLIMYQNLDPLEYIYSSDEYYLEGVKIRANLASVKSNMHTFQTILETYSVDSSGNYPNNIADLKKSATTGNNQYWKNFRNPFSNNTDEILDYEEYIKIKDTLLYKSVKIDDISALKGFVIYKRNSISNYQIYCVNIDGNLLKDDFGNDFYLTNN